MIYHGRLGQKQRKTWRREGLPLPAGIFSIRSPRRPNHIGFTVVKLIERNGNILSVVNIDMLDGTPLLDIKPYIPESDSIGEAKTDLHPEK